MNSPDFIADQAILTISAWQREALPTSDEAMLMLWKFQAERAEQQDNISNEQYGATLNAVRLCMGQING